jgi:hypothetical protein
LQFPELLFGHVNSLSKQLNFSMPRNGPESPHAVKCTLIVSGDEKAAARQIVSAPCAQDAIAVGRD